jgi:hypothetical protein
MENSGVSHHHPRPLPSAAQAKTRSISSVKQKTRSDLPIERHPHTHSSLTHPVVSRVVPPSARAPSRGGRLPQPRVLPQCQGLASLLARPSLHCPGFESCTWGTCHDRSATGQCIPCGKCDHSEDSGPRQRQSQSERMSVRLSNWTRTHTLTHTHTHTHTCGM